VSQLEQDSRNNYVYRIGWSVARMLSSCLNILFFFFSSWAQNIFHLRCRREFGGGRKDGKKEKRRRSSEKGREKE
jgi:hypothetical protein